MCNLKAGPEEVDGEDTRNLGRKDKQESQSFETSLVVQ